MAVIAMAGLSDAMAIESSDSLGAWRDYAARGVTPDFAWAERPSAELVEPSVLNDLREARSSLMPALSFNANTHGFGVAVARTYASETPSVENGGFTSPGLTRVGTGLERTFVAPSLTRNLGESTSVTGAVVIAYQQFATPGMGSAELSELYPSAMPAAFNETSVGSGVRLEVDEQLANSLSLHTAYQSKIDMEAFQSYRGVFADPGDFDVPAIASVGLGWSPAPRHRFGFDVQRVMYSDVNTFTSSALPTRFLSLLGDGATPDFSWRDLTVYGIDWSWQMSTRDAIKLRYSTQLQPEPSSSLLLDALSDEFTDNNFALGFTHRFDRAGAIHIAASYAPSQYFLGNFSYAGRDRSGDQIEVEAVWSIAF